MQSIDLFKAFDLRHLLLTSLLIFTPICFADYWIETDDNLQIESYDTSPPCASHCIVETRYMIHHYPCALPRQPSCGCRQYPTHTAHPPAWTITTHKVYHTQKHISCYKQHKKHCCRPKKQAYPFIYYSNVPDYWYEAS